MLLEVMRDVNNFFEDYENREIAQFTIDSNRIELKNDYLVNQYIAITGSVLNDNIYRIVDIEITDNRKIYTLEAELDNEIFKGTVYGLKIPKGFLSLVNEIKKNVEETPQGALLSESFSNYSYILATDKNGMPASWSSVFASQLHRWRNPQTKVRL